MLYQHQFILAITLLSSVIMTTASHTTNHQIAVMESRLVIWQSQLTEPGIVKNLSTKVAKLFKILILTSLT